MVNDGACAQRSVPEGGPEGRPGGVAHGGNNNVGSKEGGTDRSSALRETDHKASASRGVYSVANENSCFNSIRSESKRA